MQHKRLSRIKFRVIYSDISRTMFNTLQTGNGRIFYMHVTCNLFVQLSSKISYIFYIEVNHLHIYPISTIFNETEQND